jgi:hypothetical protein
MKPIRVVKPEDRKPATKEAIANLVAFYKFNQLRWNGRAIGAN